MATLRTKPDQCAIYLETSHCNDPPDISRAKDILGNGRSPMPAYINPPRSQPPLFDATNHCARAVRSATFSLPVDLINSTSLRAALFTGFSGPTDGIGTVVARSTHRISNNALASSASAWPVFTEPLWTEVGTFPSDMVPSHPGCDLVLTGTVRCKSKITHLRASFQAGVFAAEIDVFGDRVWQSRGDDLVPSEPEPFQEMPLTWAHAFGGASDYEGVEAPYVLNAKGRGFYLKREQAEGKPLPNLEWPDQHITKWDDRPLPACFAPVVDPMSWNLADIAIAAKNASNDEARDAIIGSAHERCALSACQPRMIAPLVQPGDEIRIEHVEPEPIHFRVPQGLPTVRVEPGTGSFDVPLRISAIFVLLAQQLVVITYRTEFQYVYERRKKRKATLLLNDAPANPGGT